MKLRTLQQSKLLFFVTEDWYFVSHRLQLAVAAKDAGYEVCVVTRVREHGHAIRSAGLRLIPFQSSRSGINPFGELWALARLIRLCRRERPTIIHNVAIKPVLIGTIAARFTSAKSVVNALTGLGHIFTSPDRRVFFLRMLIRIALSLLFRNSRVRVIVQNQSDRELLKSIGISTSKIFLIEGSGVDLKQFLPGPEPAGTVVVAMVSRMLWSKGVGDLVEAARFVRVTGQDIRVILIGAPDPDNPSTIEEQILESWSRDGVVEWVGSVPLNQIASIWRNAHIAVLPSFYGEGVPKSLLEAAASGKPLIATDMPGCRDVVVNEETGLLVPPRDPTALAEAIIRLAGDPALRRRLGQAARVRVEERFSIDQVIDQTLSLYRSLPGGV